MSLSVEWMLIHSLIQGGPKAVRHAMKVGIKQAHMGRPSSAPAKTYHYLTGFVGDERCPNIAEITTALDVEIPECDWDCDVEIYAEAVRKQNLQSRLLEGLGAAVAAIEKDPDRGREMVQDVFLDTAGEGQQVEFRTNNPETVRGVLERYRERKARRLAGKAVGLSTPWPSWTKRCRGYQPGEITSVLAMTGVGKTQIALVQAVHTWSHDLGPGESVLFVSLETMRETLLDRMAAIHVQLDYERMTTGHLTEFEENALQGFCEMFEEPDKSRPEIIYYGNEIKTVRDIALRCREHRPSMVIVDGIYLIDGNSRKSRWERITEAIEAIRFDVAVGCNVPVLLTCQLSSDSDEKGDKAKSKYATSIFDSSSVVLGLYGGGREGVDDARTLICLKANEFKIPFGVRINFKMDTSDFSELDCFEGDELFGSGEELD